MSNQDAPHHRLEKILRRHRQSPFRKPIAEHTAEAFRAANAIVSQQAAPLILDSGCGTGDSTQRLAEIHPHHFAIGIDKSAARLSKNPSFNPLLGGAGVGHSDNPLLGGAGVGLPAEAKSTEYVPNQSQVPQNLLLVRADLIDFWRLAVQHNWQVDKHYLLYPNPWPKKQQIKRRYHGHPVFSDLIRLGRQIELRSNWRIYVQEFAIALGFATGRTPQIETWRPAPPYLTPFEKKYTESGHRLFRLTATLSP